MPLLTVEHPDSERQSLTDIYEWYVGVTESLDAHHAEVGRALLGRGVTESRFVGFTEADLDEYFDGQQGELDRLTSANLVGSAEASIRLDFNRRVDGKLGDTLAKSYLAWYATLSPGKRERPDFDENGILERLKDSRVLPDNNVVGRFRECLKPRHWVVHGRYWAKHASVDRLTPALVLRRAQDLLNALPP